MERANAYAVLTAELELWRRKDEAELVARVGVAPIVREVELAGEVVSIEVSVAWSDATGENLTVEATANGPSHWHTQRLVERITVPTQVVKQAGRL